MITELKSTDEFEDFDSSDHVWRRKNLQYTWALVMAGNALHTFWQSATMPNNKYLKIFNARDTVLDTLGGPLPIHTALVIAKLGTLGLTGSDIENPDPNLYAKAVNSA